MSNGLYSGVSGLALGVGLYKDVSGLWSGANGLIAGFGGDGSTLSLNFINAVYEAATTAYNFQQLINFTRTSSATFVGSNGLIQNTPASVNLLTFTEQFDNAVWVKTNVSVTPDTTTAPDGTLTGDTVVGVTPGINNSIHQVYVSTGQVLTWTIRVQAGTATTCGLVIRDNTGGTNLSVSASILSGPGAVSGTNIVAVSGLSATEWTTVALTTTAATISGNQIRASFYPETATAAATTAKSNIVWGAQLETGSTATAYTRNVGGLFPPRFDYDPITLQPRGLLIEEQRTNLLLRSEDFTTTWGVPSVVVTSDTTVAPDGTTTADTLTPTSSIGYVQQPAVFTGDGTKNVSVFLKAGTSTTSLVQLRDTTLAIGRGVVQITWSGGTATAVATAGTLEGLDPYPNGWYRVRLIVPGVIAANTNQVRIQPDIVASPGTGSVIAWGAQAENGAFATSYIPTVASQVTRTADLASIEAPMFAPWYNATEGAFVVQFSPTVVDNDIPFSISASGGYANSMYTNADNASQFIVVNASVAQPQLDAGTITAGAVNNIAAAYKLNDFAVAVNGGAAATSTSGAIPTVDRAFIGGLASNTANRLNGVIRSIKYYPTRLSNAQLQALSV